MPTPIAGRPAAALVAGVVRGSDRTWATGAYGREDRRCVFGQVKEARGFRQFLLRGFEKVKPPWPPHEHLHDIVTTRNN